MSLSERTSTIVTFALITIVSLVVWLFAEARSVTEVLIDTSVTFVEDPDRLLEFPDDNWDGNVSLSLTGPRAALDTVLVELGRGISIPIGSTGISRSDPVQTVDLRDILSNSSPIQNSSVSITSIEPPSVRLRINSLQVIENVAVQLDIPGVQLQGDAIVTPQVVSVKLPSDIAAQLPSPPVVTATPRPGVIENAQEGQRYTFRVPLSVAGFDSSSSNITITPPSVEATIVVRQRVETITIAFVPVWVLLPPNESERWDVQIDDDDIGLTDVVVSGPSDLIARIRSQDLLIRGVVELTDVDLESRITSKAVQFPLLPESLRVQSDVSQVRLSITPRQDDTSAPGNGGGNGALNNIDQENQPSS
ncbi:MAG: YbbR-like domain-containing protein [Planctomycetota bacterium]|jgi:hypothetical protein